MLYRQMKFFVSIVDNNSFSEAAEKNYISQSAISQQIKNLEESLHVSLLKRGNRKFELTPAGIHFYNHAKEILNDIDTLMTQTSQYSHDSDHSLKIGYLNYYNGEELQYALAHFSKLYPKINIDVTSGTHEELRELLRLGHVDLILMFQRRAFSDSCHNHILTTCHSYIEISLLNPIAKNDCVCIDELKRIPCILVASKEQRQNEQDYYQNTLGFSGNFVFVDTLEEARLMVTGNRGFLPIDMVGTIPLPNPSTKRIHLCQGDHRITKNYCAFWYKDRTNTYIEEFVNLFQSLLSQ